MEGEVELEKEWQGDDGEMARVGSEAVGASASAAEEGKSVGTSIVGNSRMTFGHSDELMGNLRNSGPPRGSW